MKRIATVLMLAMLVVFASCEQPTILSVSQTALSFENSGGNQSVMLTANKVWTASSNQGWLRVSPSSGEGNASLSISGEGNTTYDSRTGTITIVSEELTQIISVTQAEGLGLLISQPEYNLSNEAQAIDVTVQANVQYTVDIDNACRDWIKQESTKGLSTNTIKFAISKNESYDGREGKITIRQTNGSLSATVTVKQSQTNGLFADKTEYEVSYEEQQLNIKVKSNVDYDVQIDDSCKDWISRVQTKGLTESTVSLAIAMNEDVEREGQVVLKYGGIQETVRIKQGGGFVEFEDANFKSYCLDEFDLNQDGKISYAEAKQVKKVDVNTDNIVSLTGVEKMVNLDSLICNSSGIFFVDRKAGKFTALGALTSLDVSNNKALTYLSCWGNQLSELDVSNNEKIKTILCSFNNLTTLSIPKNAIIEELGCDYNQLTGLDVSGCSSLRRLNCESRTLSCLSVSGCVALADLNCINSQLNSLDVSSCTALTVLECYGNKLTMLDVSGCSSLVKLECEGNQLATLDVSGCSSLNRLNCGYNPLTSLDLSKNSVLKELLCHSTMITSLDVRNNDLLSYLYCESCQLTSLDVKGCKALTSLFCDDNRLTTLDVSDCQNLTNLACISNQISNLVVVGCCALKKLQCYNNLLTSLKLDGCRALTLLACNDNRLTSLDVSDCSSLSLLECYNNQLTHLDVNRNIALTSLRCESNQLTDLNVSKNTTLTSLRCESNQLINLNLSDCIALTQMNCGNNMLTSLDVSNSLNMNVLTCTNNPYLTEIWLKEGQIIKWFYYDTKVATIKYK